MLALSGIHHTSNVIACIDPTCALLKTVQPQPRPQAQRHTHGSQKLKATWADWSREAPIVRQRWSAKLSHSHSQHDSVGHKQAKTLQITFVNIQARHNTENAAMDETTGAALRNEPEKKLLQQLLCTPSQMQGRQYVLQRVHVKARFTQEHRKLPQSW